MINKVYEFCKEKNLIADGDFIVAGISGGADSVCLLFMLVELQKRMKYDIHVVHVNHGIREEAGDDAAYVKSLCEKFNIPFTLVECKVEEYAKENHLSCEEAGRLVRYNSFYEVLNSNKGSRAGKIAIAHNENDLAETFIFNLFRGSGLKGLSGIQARREEIIRPLLCLNRTEIEKYLSDNNISFMTDKTNLTDDYTRNRIRHHILPEAENYVSGAISHIREAAAKIDEANSLIEEMTKLEYTKCAVKTSDRLLIKINEFNQLPQAMKGYVAKKAIEDKAGRAKDITAVHVNTLCELMEKQVGRKISLPYDIEAKRVYEGIELQIKSEEEDNDFELEIGLDDFGKEIILPNNDVIVITVKDYSEAEEKNIPNNAYTKWLDYDKMKGSICIRTKRTGDFFIHDDEGHKKQLKKYFIDAKIPAEQRNKKYLLADGNHIMWILADRISNEYKVTADTKRILVLKLIPHQESED